MKRKISVIKYETESTVGSDLKTSIISLKNESGSISSMTQMNKRR
jgi:hypothetical protein